LPEAFAAWDEMGEQLPKLLAVGRARGQLERLPLLDVNLLETEEQRDRAMMLLSFFGHASVWDLSSEGRRSSVPAAVAIPWVAVARLVGRPPALSYASHALTNWRRFDSSGPLEIDNLAVLQNFLGGMDEDWFILLHVALEARSAPAVGALRSAQSLLATTDDRALADHEIGRLTDSLEVVAGCAEGMIDSISRMRERCDPHVFFHRIQPFLHGFGSQVEYEGVESPGELVGASAAQSPLVPFLDAALGIEHEPDALVTYLVGMQRYMPPWHRELIRAAANAPSIRAFVLSHRSDTKLVESYNACVDALLRFRTSHLEYPAAYIQGPARRASRAGADTGTGGTPFAAYLKKLRDETAAHRIE
jgi:indoleamine 2,3-dioxygenase